eukprot:1236110-Prymnesium_polylepis.1
MEYVPASRLAEVEAVSTIHPWTIVDQGGGKWRLCHDYSVGTNKVVPTAPFVLPSVWDVVGAVKPGSRFAKYDIRDGFWHMPIGEDSKKRLVVRHPGTGRLIWASRLPFGYLGPEAVLWVDRGAHGEAQGAGRWEGHPLLLFCGRCPVRGRLGGAHVGGLSRVGGGVRRARCAVGAAQEAGP